MNAIQDIFKMNRLLDAVQSLFPRKRLDIFGKDSLLHSVWPYYVLPVLMGAGLFLQQPNPWPFIAIVYAGFPIFDQIFSLDARNPSTAQRKDLQRRDGAFRSSLYVTMILDWAVFIKTCIVMTHFQLSWSTAAHLTGIIFILINQSTAQFAVAHQIMHKPHRFYRILGTLHMLKLYYTHFTYHHLYRHHHDVATKEDPSTSLKGENIYHFFVRCVKDSWKGVYQDEKRKGKDIWRNSAVLSLTGSFAFAAMVYLVFGLQPLIVHSIIAFGAIFYLEAVNYIQHYGLLRKKLPNGQYEKVTILHSWNAPHRFTNYLLFKLQRHSDHHENSTKPFQTLNSLEESPFLSHGYNLMVLMSLFPKVWFKVMDPLVDSYRSLSLEDQGKIDPQVRIKAERDTRRFLVEVAASAMLLLGLSIFKII